MNFDIKYNKLSHQFFYLQNMSMWRYFCRKEYNDAWLKITGPLSCAEEKSIQDFKEILLGNIMKFYGSTFNKNKLPQGIENLEEIFKETSEGFDKIWNVIKDDLPKASENLKKLINEKQEIIAKTIEQLRHFYNSKAELPETVNVHLILLPESVKSGGGKFFPENNVVLEGSLSGRFNGTISTPVEVMLHEITHLYFEDHLKNLYEKHKEQIDYHPLKEATISGLLPYGYLSSKFFGAVVKESFTHYPFVLLAKNYIESNKIIDDAFVSRCIELKRTVSRSNYQN